MSITNSIIETTTSSEGLFLKKNTITFSTTYYLPTHEQALSSSLSSMMTHDVRSYVTNLLNHDAACVVDSSMLWCVINRVSDSPVTFKVVASMSFTFVPRTSKRSLKSLLGGCKEAKKLSQACITERLEEVIIDSCNQQVYYKGVKGFQREIVVLPFDNLEDKVAELLEANGITNDMVLSQDVDPDPENETVWVITLELKDVTE